MSRASMDGAIKNIVPGVVYFLMHKSMRALLTVLTPKLARGNSWSVIAREDILLIIEGKVGLAQGKAIIPTVLVSIWLAKQVRSCFDVLMESLKNGRDRILGIETSTCNRLP